MTSKRGENWQKTSIFPERILENKTTETVDSFKRKPNLKAVKSNDILHVVLKVLRS
jgi:hypothetical protein